MNVAAFAVVGMLQRDPSRFGGLNSFAGLASRSPGWPRRWPSCSFA